MSKLSLETELYDALRMIHADFVGIYHWLPEIKNGRHKIDYALTSIMKAEKALARARKESEMAIAPAAKEE